MYEASPGAPLQAALDLNLLFLNDFLVLEGVCIGSGYDLKDLSLLDLQLLNLFVSLQDCLRRVVITMLGLFNHEAWHHILVQERIPTLAGQ